MRILAWPWKPSARTTFSRGIINTFLGRECYFECGWRSVCSQKIMCSMFHSRWDTFLGDGTIIVPGSSNPLNLLAPHSKKERKEPWMDPSRSLFLGIISHGQESARGKTQKKTFSPSENCRKPFPDPIIRFLLPSRPSLSLFFFGLWCDNNKVES